MTDLTDYKIDEVFHSMPNGVEGFLKNWGYRTFARALLDAMSTSGPPTPPLLPGMVLVPCSVMRDQGSHPQNGWLFVPHADGKWVTAAKLDAFSERIIDYWLKSPPAEKD